MKKFTSLAIFLSMVLMCVPVLAADEAPAADKDTRPTELPYQERRVPILAGALSIVPGLGQVYNQEYATGAIYFTVTASLYMAALYYADVFEDADAHQLRYESIFLFALAGGIHALSIFDATLEASRVNENLDRWSLMVGPRDGGFTVAYGMRF